MRNNIAILDKANNSPTTPDHDTNDGLELQGRVLWSIVLTSRNTAQIC